MAIRQSKSHSYLKIVRFSVQQAGKHVGAGTVSVLVVRYILLDGFDSAVCATAIDSFWRNP